MNEPLSPELLAKMNAYWRAANYLSVGQIYLYDNPLLKEPLKPEHVKPRLLGHWGTTPGLNFIYVHLNRLIKKHDLNVLYVTGTPPRIAGRNRFPRRDLSRAGTGREVLVLSQTRAALTGALATPTGACQFPLPPAGRASGMLTFTWYRPAKPGVRPARPRSRRSVDSGGVATRPSSTDRSSPKIGSGSM